MFGTTLSLALRSIRRHILRSFLTILGIVIGVGAVVTMVTLGKATTAAVQQSISALGTDPVCRAATRIMGSPDSYCWTYSGWRLAVHPSS